MAQNARVRDGELLGIADAQAAMVRAIWWTRASRSTPGFDFNFELRVSDVGFDETTYHTRSWIIPASIYGSKTLYFLHTYLIYTGSTHLSRFKSQFQFQISDFRGFWCSFNFEFQVSDFKVHTNDLIYTGSNYVQAVSNLNFSFGFRFRSELWRDDLKNKVASEIENFLWS